MRPYACLPILALFLIIGAEGHRELLKKKREGYRYKTYVDFVIKDDMVFSPVDGVVSEVTMPTASGPGQMIITVDEGGGNYNLVTVALPMPCKLQQSKPGATVAAGQALCGPRPCKQFWKDSRPMGKGPPAATYRTFVRPAFLGATGGLDIVSKVKLVCGEPSPTSTEQWRRVRLVVTTKKISKMDAVAAVGQAVLSIFTAAAEQQISMSWPGLPFSYDASSTGSACLLGPDLPYQESVANGLCSIPESQLTSWDPDLVYVDDPGTGTRSFGS